eukprot:TRINITY_DN64535_c0_g1_i1.p1 TRINITY_DN64535_c0_g1~~TRINITY_DN64535_c0_g1_i1.p1  ORF type:complete len:529 (+),score=47.18 TRINITY_DN64535_c0_g1_i1:155-1588(+)
MVREIYGGSKLRDFVEGFMEPIPDSNVGAASSKVSELSNGQYEQTFISPPLTLSNGFIANKWLPIDWPRGHIAIKAFAAEVVKAGPRGEVPPPTACCGGDPYVASRDEVFMHHWTVNKWQLPASLFKDLVNAGGLDYHLTLREKAGYIEFLAGAGLNSGANGPCWDSNLHLYFGIGNEVRSLTSEGKFPYEFPDPYGVIFDSEYMRKHGEFMVLNTHLIDLRNARDKRACSECKCSELGSRGFLNITEGGLSCCHSTSYGGGKCHLKPGAEVTNQTYFIRYTVRWHAYDPASTLPLEVMTFDATDNNTKWGDLPFISGGFPESHSAMKQDPMSLSRVNDGRSGDFDGKRACHVEWYVPPCKSGESCVTTIRNSWQLPYPLQVVFLRNHFHAGGINMTTWSNGWSCTGNSSYDSHGDLVEISTCAAGDHPSDFAPQIIPRGSELFVESTYQKDAHPHYGVMSMSFIYAHIPAEEDILV